ncbi:MAG: ABC transporter substrate-binding protein [Firmicutes bacterium]|nr:ABC transporter substrate-binding protein [Bacillota bacterium]
MKKRVLVLLLAVVLVFGMTACGGSTGEDPAPAAPSGEAETILFTDDIGREVEIPKDLSRIVPAAALPQMILVSLAPDMLVGTASDLYDSGREFLPEYLYDLQCFGSLYTGAELNVEELAVTEPQLIIDMGEPKASIEEDLNTLQEQTQIPAIYISTSLQDLPETYRKLGALLGREERAEELAQFCEKVYDRTLSIMEEVGDNKVDCLYVLGQEGLNVIAAGSYHAELFDLLTNNLAVVDNPLSKGTGNEVTMEQLSLWNPEFVIFGPDSIYSTVKENDTWLQIDAVANDRYVEVPDLPYNWMSMPPANQRYLGLIWLTAELYPEYCDYDVEAEIREAYRLFYSCELTDEQYETITQNAFLR